LKACGMILLAICLLEPVKTTEVPRQGENLFLIMADTSQSMQIHDNGSEQSRADQLGEWLIERAGWQETLEEAFAVRKFAFARQVKSDD